MGKALNVLMVEDSAADAELITFELVNAGFDLTCKRVQTERDFLEELAKKPDIVLSDYSMPQFSGLRAAELTRDSSLGVPFILISGTVGEEVAVEAMKKGATDYLLKDRLARLGQAIDRALLESRERARLKQAEQELQTTHAQLRQLLEHSPAVIYSLKVEGKKLVPKIVSENVTMLLGFTVTETLSPEWWLTQLHPDDREDAIASISETLVDGASLTNYRIRHKDGAYRWVEDKRRLICSSADEPDYIVGVWADITERRRLEAQLLQSQKMEGIGQLAGGVAHDFNNILSVIQMQSGLLKGSGQLSCEQVGFADEIMATVQRAAALTRQLLLFSRREVFQPRDLDLNECVSHMTKMLQRILGETIQMELKLAPPPVFVHADPGMIDQVLMNLTVNARDAMPDGGRLIIETDAVEFDHLAASLTMNGRPGSFISLSVSDSGSGIAPEILPKIFEPFFTTKEPGKGTGLGLATVFGIVQQHQGWISVYSEPGNGTTFRIYLPQLAGNRAQLPATQSRPEMRGGTETILLAEDDPILCASVHRALARLGYTILEARNGARALDMWKKNSSRIDLLLTDLVMPGGMTGKELGQQILKENPKLRVIYMSGYSAEIAGRDFPLEEGLNFLVKPFQVEKLAATIRARLDR
ncbi:MAG TPA: response regulator [Verrucomicrobiae bacterium]|jgi:PAS domain S-box-containing protein|nr:response regulator [Verrucomicrobiae bacterium]